MFYRLSRLVISFYDGICPALFPNRFRKLAPSEIDRCSLITCSNLLVFAANFGWVVTYATFRNYYAFIA